MLVKGANGVTDYFCMNALQTVVVRMRLHSEHRCHFVRIRLKELVYNLTLEWQYNISAVMAVVWAKTIYPTQTDHMTSKLHQWYLRSMVEYKPLISLGIYVAKIKTEFTFLRDVTMVSLYTTSTWTHSMSNIITLIHLATDFILSPGSLHLWIS